MAADVDDVPPSAPPQPAPSTAVRTIGRVLTVAVVALGFFLIVNLPFLIWYTDLMGRSNKMGGMDPTPLGWVLFAVFEILLVIVGCLAGVAAACALDQAKRGR